MNKIDITEDRVAKTIGALRANGFEVWFAGSRLDAEQLFWEQLFEKNSPRSVSWGDSLTMNSLGLIPKLKKLPQVELIETFGEHLPRTEIIANRKKALTADMFLTGTNAITARGQLVNLDMMGNRVAAITFGPRKVVIFAGVNKIVDDIDSAMQRIKTVAAPMNAKRHPEFETPCQITGKCIDCSSPKRLCNTWTITEKAYPPGRIKIIMINEQLGY